MQSADATFGRPPSLSAGRPPGVIAARSAGARAAAFLRRNVVPLSALALALVYGALGPALHLRPEITVAVYAPLALYAAGLLLRRLRFDRGTVAILLVGLVLYFLYLGYTTPGERNYDGPEQIKYLTFIAEKHTIPPSNHCFICHHPPLYYVLSALVYLFFQGTKIASNPLGVQIFSLAIFFGFLVYGALLARLYSDSTRMIRAAAALLVFWPYSFHNSVRIHNDTLATMLVAAGMYHAARWYKEDRARHLFVAALFAALGILTKSTAYALVGAIGLMLAYRFFTRPGRARLLVRGTIAVGIMAAAFGLNSLRAPVKPDRCHRLFGTACDIRPTDFTGNKPINYLYLDVPKFVREPYMVIANDSSGKQYFWNHVLKSSLFGTHNKIPDRETTYALNRTLAWYMNVDLLALLAFVAAAGVLGARRGLRRFGVPVLFVVMSSAVLMAFKIMIPAPHHTDFRHIYFVMAPAALLFAAAREHMRGRSRVLGAAGTALYAPLLALSILYFLPKYDLVMKYTHSTTELPLSAVQKVVTEGAPWDRDGNLLIEGNETIVLDVPKTTVRSIDISVDGNDTYELRLLGKNPARVILVRPRKVVKVGLARHNLPVDPPVEDVTRITVRPLSGDRTYAMGHLLLNTGSVTDQKQE